MFLKLCIYIYVSKGALSIGEIKFWGKVAEGGSDFRQGRNVPRSLKLGIHTFEKVLYRCVQ